MDRTISLSALFVAFGLTCLPAQAQSLEALQACGKIADPAERLACFDAAVQADVPMAETIEPAVKTEPAPAAVATSDTAQSAQPATQAASVASTSESPASVTAPQTADADDVSSRGRVLPSWFPRVSISLGGDDGVEEPDFIDTTLTRIQRNNVGRHFFTTDDGVWRQIQVGEVRAPKSLPVEARIKRTLTGSLRLEIIGTNRSYPVVRIE